MAAIQFTEATKAYPRTIAPAGKYPIVGDRIYRTLQDAQDYVDGKSSSKSAIPGIYLSVIDDGINNGAYWVEQAAGYDGATVGVLRKMGAGGGGGGDISLAWDDITDKPAFAAVATSGSYNDLTDKPTIPDLSVLGALAYKDSLSWSEIAGRPTKLSDFSNDAGFITSAALAGYLKEEDAETIYITEEEAEDRYVKRGGDSINGDISFGGSIKIGGATLSWDEASHALKVDTSFYTEKQLASGGIGDASGSGLGLILNEWPTDSEDYSKYALGGNLGIELNTRLTAVEGKATNVTVSPTLSQGKPMGTIMVDGVSQTMYAPASYSADDIVPTQERNFVSLQDIEYWNTAYLPKTGGTLKGSLIPDKDGAYHLGSSSYRLGVVFALQGVFYGGLSINHESVATQTWAEERYLKLSGGAIGRDGSNSFPLNIESTSSYTGIAFVTSGGRAWMRYMGGSDWGVTDAEWKNSYTLIHSGNIGSQSVSSAIKLADDTAFTVWGQKFFENGKPKSISMNTAFTATCLNFRNKENDAAAGYVGRGDPSSNNIILFSYTNLKFYTNSTTRMFINSSGNVTIGSSDLAGTSAKLYVDGVARASGLIGNNVCVACGSDGTTSGYSGEINRFGGGNLYIQGREGGLMLGFDGNTTTVRGMLVVNRDVGIGTDPAHKFHVNGTSGLKATYFHHTTGTAADKGAFLLQYYNAGTNDILALTSRTGSNLAYKSNILTVNWATGNVGIGEIHSPQYKLDVNGDIRTNASLRIGSAVLSWDSTNNALKIEGNVYATGQMASGGIGAAVATIASDHEDRIAQLEAKVESLMS